MLKRVIADVRLSYWNAARAANSSATRRRGGSQRPRTLSNMCSSRRLSRDRLRALPGHPSHVTAVTLGRSYAPPGVGGCQRRIIEAGVLPRADVTVFGEYVYAMIVARGQQAKSEVDGCLIAASTALSGCFHHLRR